MKLYIFKCRARARMFGATRYETASNLPTNECSGGWEFHERVDLTPLGRLRYAVDTRTVRRYVEQRGWHVWDESPLESRKREVEPPAVPAKPQPAPAEPEPVAVKGAETASSSGREQPQPQPQTATTDRPAAIPRKEPAESTPVSQRPQPRPPEPEVRVADKSRSAIKRDMVESVPLPRRPEPLPEPETFGSDDLAAFMRRELAASAPSPRRPQEPPAEPRKTVSEQPTSSRTAAPGASTSPSGQAPAQKPLPRRTIGDVPPSRPAPSMKPDSVEAAPSVPRLATQHRVVWFDIPVRDIDRAVRFYSAVLKIPLKKEQAGPGAAVAVLPHAEGSIGGSLVQNMDAKPSDGGPLVYLNTQGRLDDAVAAVVKHGGKVLAERHSIAPFGFRAIVLDSEGNRIALHSKN